MDIEQIFNQVKAHLLKQNQQSKQGMFCKYRNYGLMCAVGCLITNQEYVEEREGNGVSYITRTYPNAFQHLDLTDAKVEMLVDLQELHDDTLPHAWPTGLDVIYNKFVAH